jgi:tRNA-dihydrouridine synthase B
MFEYSERFKAKKDSYLAHQLPIKLGQLELVSPFILAPMAGICSRPYRLLMEELGAGATVSELVSAHGINHGNERTLEMLKIHPLEKKVGLQLFGEDKDSLVRAAQTAQKYGPGWIDLNMGCPVNKVVSKGGGSALLKEAQKLPDLFKELVRSLEVPFTIKIRTGWDQDHRNALEVIKMAQDAGVQWVAIHGRTRTQGYAGLADWDFMESLAREKVLPLIGNGDLHSPALVAKRWAVTDCEALMLARGALRNPFIFLESLVPPEEQTKYSPFMGEDYWEVVQRLWDLTIETFDHERTFLVQVKKFIVWFAAGFPHAAAFRSAIFAAEEAQETYELAQRFFLELGDRRKHINPDEVFMSSGHG